MRILRSLYLQNRFFYGLLLCFLSYLFAFFFPIWLLISHGLLLVFIGGFALDFILLYSQGQSIEVERIVGDKLSNGDENKVDIRVKNLSESAQLIKLIDELPFQFQIRDFELFFELNPKEEQSKTYTLRPTERGVYQFGNIIVFQFSKAQLLARKHQFEAKKELKVLPSFLQLKAFSQLISKPEQMMRGKKKTRRFGHSMEFEQIRNYIQGDDIRNLNWKATAKQNKLMVNQFQEEKSQQVYALIDRGRSMQMPFNGLSLLDYAINSALVLLNVALRNEDKVGMLSFSKKVANQVLAHKRGNQMEIIQNALYNIDTDYSESDYGKLYTFVNSKIKRSLLLLFTNFESEDALKRQLPYLRALAKSHVLVLIFFENTEITSLANQQHRNSSELTSKILARSSQIEKIQMLRTLRKSGIMGLLTKPEELTTDLIAKYLEMKERGVL